jgi:cytidine deaminase
MTGPPDDGPRADVDALVAAARAARERAYAPYSDFLVGAAVIADGETFTAPNIENASYPLSVCAERNAVAVAVAAGHRRIRAVAVVGSGDTPTPPCGGCRQVLFEFGGPGLTVICESPAGARTMWALEDLLPEAFGPDDLPS